MLTSAAATLKFNNVHCLQLIALRSFPAAIRVAIRDSPNIIFQFWGVPNNMAATNPSGRRVLKQGKSDASQDRSSWGTSGLHFVVSTNVEKPDPELRKVIRSHVMMGKNRGKTFPCQKKKTKDVHDPSFSSSNTPLASTSSPDEDLVGPPASSATASHPVCQFAVPRKFGTDWSTFRFPDGVEPGTVDVVLQCEWCLTISACYANS